MTAGYQLIDVGTIDELVIKQVPADIHASVVHWVVSILKKQFASKKLAVEVKVVIANYQGKYPTIGLKYLENDIPDLHNDVVVSVDKILSQNNFFEYYDFIIKHSNEINETILKLESS